MLAALSDKANCHTCFYRLKLAIQSENVHRWTCSQYPKGIPFRIITGSYETDEVQDCPKYKSVDNVEKSVDIYFINLEKAFSEAKVKRDKIGRFAKKNESGSGGNTDDYKVEKQENGNFMVTKPGDDPDNEKFFKTEADAVAFVNRQAGKTKVPEGYKIAKQANGNFMVTKPGDDPDNEKFFKTEADAVAFANRQHDKEKWASPEANADRILALADKTEPAITKSVVEISTLMGVQMAGLPHRKKKKDSLTRKLKSDYEESRAMTMEQVAHKIGDAVRYTAVLDADKYVDQVLAFSEAMKERGLIPYDHKFKNFWGKSDYKGINTNWIDKNGQKFEMQFHTKESLHVKESESHPIYEKLRVEKSVSKKEEYMTELRGIWNKIRLPENFDMLSFETVFKEAYMG